MMEELYKLLGMILTGLVVWYVLFFLMDGKSILRWKPNQGTDGMNPMEYVYILSATGKAMELYRSSLETLLASNNYDFMVYRFKKDMYQDVVTGTMEDWEESIVAIDEAQYHILYRNLCHKLREAFKAKNKDLVFNSRYSRTLLSG